MKTVVKYMLGLASVWSLAGCSKFPLPEIVKPAVDQTDKKSTTNISAFDAAANIYSRNTALLGNNAMQGFNFDSDGSIWYTQSGESAVKHQINLVKSAVNKNTSILTANTDFMKLSYFGHGTNTAMEEVGSDRYVWIGAYGSANNAGEYWNEKLIGRVKYVKGKTVKTNECDEYYYIGKGYTDMHPCIDAENDLLTINYADPTNNAFRCFMVFKLSEARQATMTNTVVESTDGFETNNPSSLNKKSYTVYCRDLTKLTPVAKMKFRKTGYGNANATYYDWQGFDVHKDKLYYVEGQSNYNLFGSFFTDDVSQSYVTIFDFNGNIVEERTQVAVISDRNALKSIGMTELGAMESEGIKVYKGKLYLGYTSRGITQQDTKHYQNIFVFDDAKK
ncbi:hypothetical protein [Sphingobacterium psychroaquaticum]|uniref:Uncharacterized protein n=1 Tax=Sphingobacterium psychroaquaticum TaxID=561061 RepID=A0A1X7IF21_9SPHI|nr:hypothetical protein [Sphingobacterium psychroaquaticum]SMG12789.1 hypothetical protein SAMN05660862_0723 [Sphingobacterium psychroaquaticum]